MNRRITKKGVLYVGFKCNANCGFCYYRHKPAKHWFNVENLKRQLDTFKKGHSNEYVDITGGEPSIYPEIIELIKYASNIGIKPTLITNGIATSDINYLKKMKDAGLNDLLVSVQGYKEKMDGITNVKGHYEKAMKTLDNCVELEIPFRINTVVHKHSYKDLKKIAEVVCDKGAKAVNFIIFNPFYEWGAFKGIEFQVKHSDITSYLCDAIEEVESHKIECNVRYFPFCMVPEEYRHTIMNWMQLPYDRNEWDFSSWYGWDISEKAIQIEAGRKAGIFSMNENELAYNTFAVGVRGGLYRKPDRCNVCALKYICDALSKQYAARFGSGEVMPVEGEEIKDPLYYKTRWKK